MQEPQHQYAQNRQSEQGEDVGTESAEEIAFHGRPWFRFRF